MSGTPTTMTYGDYSFSPVPLITINRENIQRGNRDLPIGYLFTMTLNGTLTPLPDSNGGLDQTDDLIEELRQAFDRDGKRLEINCGATLIMAIYPSIKSINFEEGTNQWVQTVPYTIEIEYCNDELGEHPEAPPYIEDFSEEWNMEFIQDTKFFTWDLSSLNNQDPNSDYVTIDQNNPFEARVTHSISIKGKQTWADPGGGAATGISTSAVDNAMSWVTGTYMGFGYDAHAFGHALSGWTNLIAGTGYSEYDHYRTHSVNETDGTVNLTESWIILGNQSGLNDLARRITEDFTINIRKSNTDGKVNVSVEGQIQGREERDYSVLDATTPTTTSAYTNAETAWAVLQDRIFPRAQYIFQQDYSTLLHPSPLNKTIGHQPSRGIITYNYEFDDRPCSFITGSLSEQFSISDNHPSDVFAKLTVLGRVQGPVLQEITTVTEAIREVSIEAIMPQPTGCSSITDLDLNKPTTNVENLLCEFETQLTSAYDQVFKNSDRESWNPNTGRYSKIVSWTYASCSGTINTSFC